MRLYAIVALVNPKASVLNETFEQVPSLRAQNPEIARIAVERDGIAFFLPQGREANLSSVNQLVAQLCALACSAA